MASGVVVKRGSDGPWVASTVRLNMDHTNVAWRTTMMRDIAIGFMKPDLFRSARYRRRWGCETLING